jgi:Glycoside hydrolase 123, N-terminal domain
VKQFLITLGLITVLPVMAADLAGDMVNFQTPADAIEAGWKANYGSVLKTEGGVKGKSLKALGATHHGGLTWRPVNLDLTGVEKMCFRVRQNVHSKYPFCINIQIKHGIGKIRYINKVTPGGAGWGKWQKVCIDLSKEKLGKVSTIGFYSAAFRNTKTKFLKLDDLHFIRKPLENPTEKLQPVYTFPFMKKAPVIDGVIGEAEWRNAGGTSGFVGLSGMFASRQTIVKYAFDDNNLYFAFTSPFESAGNHARGKSGKLSRANLSNRIDFFELWLKTPENHIQYMVNMNNGVFQYDHNKRKLLETGVKYRSSFKVNNYLNGGTWYGEMSIPLAAIGNVAKSLKVLFARDFPSHSNQRSQDDWTSSSPIKIGFNKHEFYPQVTLSKTLTAISINKFGKLEECQVTTSGLAINPKKQKYTIKMGVFADGPGYLLKNRKTYTGKKSPEEFTIGETLKLNEKTNAYCYLQVTETASGKIVYAQKFKFLCGSPLRIKSVPLAKTGELILRVDTRSLKELPSDSIMQVNVSSGGKEVQTQKFKLTGNRKINIFKMNCASLKPQSYRVEYIIRKNRKVLARTADSQIWLGIPAWINNIGISDEIPQPWTPIKVDGNKISIVERDYTLSPSGLPAKIIAIGKDILAAPARLHASIGGMPESIKFKPLKLVQVNSQKVIYAIHGSSRRLELSGTLTVEYDGFALWSLKVKPRMGGVLEKMFIKFSMPNSRALYARGNIIGGTAGGYSANLDRRGNAKPVKIAWSEHSYNGWAWTKDFFYNFFIGDDDSGVTFMSESPEFHNGDRHISIVNRNRNREVTIMLTSGQVLVPDKELKYEYAWQGLPLKPRPKNPKLWHQAIGSTVYIDKPLLEIDPELFKEVPFWVGARYMRYDSHYQISNANPAKRVKRRVRMNNSNFIKGIRKAEKYGTKVLTDGIYFSAMDTISPEARRHINEWRIMPGGYSWYNYHGGLDIAACPQSSWQDFMVYTCAKILDTTPLGGVYLDVSAETPCDNQYHGCGYTDSKGQRHKTVNLWSMRKLHKRVYTYYNTGGRKGGMFHHHLDCAAWSGFCNVGFQGEEWAAFKNYDKMTPEFFRAMTMNQYGTPYTFFSIFSYYQTIKMSEVMSLCLPHYTMPAIWSYRKENWPAVKPYWNIMDKWWTSAKFIGYWFSQPPSDVKDGRILVSACVKRGSALLIASNWKWKAENITMRVNPKSIGFIPSRAYDMFNKKPVVIKNGQLKLKINARNVMLIKLFR